jgi:predicted membrane channel-forming protein YqfA (hemolysin III family)
LFTLHNETGDTSHYISRKLARTTFVHFQNPSLIGRNLNAGNVWLHFAPALYIAYAILQWAVANDHPHKLAFYTVLVPEMMCLLLSSAYHLFMAQVKHYDTWLKIDVRSNSSAGLQFSCVSAV